MTGLVGRGIRRLTVCLALVALISTIAAPAAWGRPDGANEKKEKQEQETTSGNRSDRGRSGADEVDDADPDPSSNASGDRSASTFDDDGGAGDGSDRGLDRFEGSDDGSGSSVSDMTITVGCYSVEVTSSKDISHVEVTFADGTTVKFEGLSGHRYSNRFDQPVLSAHAKSGTTIVTDTVSGDCSAVAPPTTCPDGSPMPADGVCDQVGGRIIELCPDGSEMPASGDLEDCDPTVLCPDGSEMPAGGNCGDGVPCPVGTTMDAAGNCLEDEVTGAAEERPCPLNPIMGVVVPILCGDESADPSDQKGGVGAGQDENPADADDEGVEPDLGARGVGRGAGVAREGDPADADGDSVLGTRLDARAPSRAAAAAVSGAVVARGPEVESGALPATGTDLVAFVVLALMLVAIGGLSWRGRPRGT